MSTDSTLRWSSSAVLQLSRTWRHGLANHLQIIMGWLQLDEPGRAQDYVVRLIDRIAAESAMVRQCAPDFAAFWLVQGARLEASGVTVYYVVPPGFSGFSWPGADWASELAATLDHLISLDLAATPTVTVHLHEGGRRRTLILELRGAVPQPECPPALAQVVRRLQRALSSNALRLECAPHLPEPGILGVRLSWPIAA